MTSIIFDLDETLVDRTETMRCFLVDQYSRLNKHIITTAEAYVTSVLHHQKNGYEDKHKAYQLACLDLMGSDKIAEMLFLDFKNKYGFEAVLFEGVKNTLETLSQQYSLAVVTNGRARCQNAKIDFLGIRHFFRVIKISEDFGSKKPNLEIFKSCIEELGSNADSCICVGDNPDNDLKPAQALGMRVIWVRNNNFSPPEFADAIIDSVSNINQAIIKMA